MSNEDLIALNKELEEKLQERTKELKDLEEKFNTIAENSLMGILILQDNKIKYANQLAANLGGYTISETMDFSPTKIFEFIHPQDRIRVMEQLSKKQSGSTDYITNYQYRIINKSGEVRWLDNYSRSIDYMGKPADMVSVKDITERRNAEKRLKESEEKFRTITEHSTIGIIIIQDDKVKYVNKAMSIINEFTADEMLEWSPKELLNYIHPEDRKQAIEYLRGRQIGEAALPPYSSYRTITKNGKIKWVDSYSKTITFRGRLADLALITDVTDQNLAKRELKESEERLKFLVTNNPAIIYTSKVTGDYGATFVSDNIQKEWGYSSEDFISNSEFWLNHIHPDDKEHVLSALSDLIETGRIVIYDYRFKIKDGSYRWMRDESKLVKDEQGNIIETIGSVIDINERKIAEQKLKESEEKYRHLYEHSPFSIVLLDPEGIITDMNTKTTELFGYDREDLIGKNYLNLAGLYLDETKPGVRLIPELISIGEPSKIMTKPQAIKIFNKEKSPIWVISELSIVKIGGKLLIQAIIQDITEKKIAEEKLKESEEKYRHLFELSPFSIVLMDYNGKIVDMNTKTTELFGYKKEDIIEKNYFTLAGVFPNDTKPGLRLVQDLLSKGEPNNPIMKPQITEIYNKEKELIWVESELSSVNIRGKPMIQIIIQNITEKKLADEKLKESERILRQQNLELKELDRLKTDFISIAAHDLKTPLISVGGYIDLILLREKGLNEEIQEDLGRVLNNVRRLEDYINRLLDVMKIDAKKVELVRREEIIYDIITRCFTDLEFQIDQKNLTVNCDISQELTLKVDNFRISQIFLNLLSNAVKFTPKNGRIDISGVEDDESIIFSIKDNGKGLTPEEMQKIFGKFVTIEQGVDGHSTLDKGSGLGLYITKGFIEAHGGKIWVESKGRDLGAEFSFVLPKE